MTFLEFLNQIYTSSPDWIKALLIAIPPIFVLTTVLGLLTIAARFILGWRALSLSRDEVRRLNALPLDEANQSDQPRQPPHPFTAPDDDPHFPLAKPEDYAPFNEPYADETPPAMKEEGGSDDPVNPESAK